MSENTRQIASSQNRSVKTFLGRFLADEGITVEHNPKAKTAWFDTNDRVLTVPVWAELDDDIYTLLIGHEVGHAIYTPNITPDTFLKIDPDPNNIHIVKIYANIIEDARIERFVKEKYPGIVRFFTKGYKSFWNSGKFGVDPKNFDPTNFTFIDRLNIKAKMGSILDDKLLFDSYEKDFYDRVSKAMTFDEVMALTKEIYDRDKQNAQNQMNSQTSSDGEESKNGKSGKSGKGKESSEGEGKPQKVKNLKIKVVEDSSEDDGGLYGSKNPSIDVDEDGNAEMEVSIGNGPQTGTDLQSMLGDDCKIEIDDPNNIIEKTKSAMKDRGSYSPTTSMGIPLTQTTINDSIKEYASQGSSTNVIYRDVPYGLKNELPNIIDNYKNVLTYFRNSSNFNSNTSKDSFISKNKSYINTLCTEFDAKKKATIYKKSSVANTGIINPTKLHSYRFNEDIFKRTTSTPNGKNHGVVIVIDWSGSMSSYIGDTINQVLMIVSFCKKVNIPFQVYAFSDTMVRNGNEYTNTNSNHGTLNMCPLRLIELLSNKMTGSEYSDMIKYLSHIIDNPSHLPPEMGLGGTPLDASILVSSEIVKTFKLSNKLEVVNFIVITDGYNGDNTCGAITSNDIFVLRNSRDNSQIAIKGSDFGNGYVAGTTALLKSLKMTTDSNVVGFFLCCENSAKSKINEHTVNNPKTRETLLNNLNKCGFAEIKESGYDSYFIVNTEKLNVKDTVNSVEDIFTCKKKNRILLSKFMDIFSKKI